MIASKERDAATGKRLSFEDLRTLALRIKKVGVANEVAGTRHLDQDSAAVRTRAVNLHHATENREHHVRWRALQEKQPPFRIADQGVTPDQTRDRCRGYAAALQLNREFVLRNRFDFHAITYSASSVRGASD